MADTPPDEHQQGDGPEVHRRFVLGALATSAVLGPIACSGVREDARVPPPSSDGGRTRKNAARDSRPLPPSIEPTIRVRVAKVRSKGGSPPEQIVLGRPGQRLWVTTPELDLPGRAFQGPLQVRAGNGGWFLGTEGRRRQGTEQINTATPLAIAAIGEKPIEVNGKPIQGLIRVVRRTDLKPGECDVVCHLPMETYLPGVLHSELFGSWPQATFEAQAVAARSFACCERSFWIGRRHYDVVSGPSSQAWSGGDASDRARNAVKKTYGVVLVWDGKVVPAYYSSACGGLPATASDVISSHPSNRIGPLTVDGGGAARPRGCCEQSPHSSWSCEVSSREIQKALVAYGRREGERGLERLGPIRGIEVASRNPAGRPVRHRILSTPSVEIDSEDLRSALNGLKAMDGKSVRMKSACLEFSPTTSGYTIRGQGFGHGVGLCQYGAKAMGVAGASPRDILVRYYPGADLVQAWSDGVRSSPV